MTRMERRIVAAREVADFLRGIGQHKRAQDVVDLCRSATMSRFTAQALHAELEDTRRAAGMPTWERSK